jgi:uncharacterized protein YydD (DUF2326 family)
MKDIFKKIVRTLNLRDFAPEMEAEIQVWVNPPRAVLTEYSGLVEAVRSIRTELDSISAQLEDKQEAETGRQRAGELAQRLNEVGRAQMEIFAQLWSQGPEETRWTIQEIEQLVERAADTDPALWLWLCRRTLEMITAYRQGQKKA